MVEPVHRWWNGPMVATGRFFRLGSYGALLDTTRAPTRGSESQSGGGTSAKCEMGVTPEFAVQVVDLKSPLIHVRGEVDVATAPKLADCILTSLARDPRELELDLTDTTFLDCAGIGVIVWARNQLPDEARVVLRQPNPRIRRILDILKMDTVVAIKE